MIYEFTDGLTLLRNKQEWEAWDKELPGREHMDEPYSYPVLVCSFTYDGYNGDVTFAQYIYPKDVSNLITEHWEQEDKKNEN